ncbi:hypothetical protein [Desulfurivibrio sp. C05AmB]|uniref:hypothetical protein n=1 Tax=Desulfurivibrio sp. C05AmB TaxID=3374371 RepID=UPI00376F27C1
MSEALQRQRRNVTALSSLLILFNFADVSIAKVSLLGTELLVGDPAKLAAFVWLIWVYFLLRYYQYWREEPDKGLSKAFRDRFDRCAKDYTGKDFVQDMHGSPRYYKLSREGWFNWRYSVENVHPVEGNALVGENIPISIIRVCAWAIFSAIHVCINTPRVTEHVLPFPLAILALASTLLV